MKSRGIINGGAKGEDREQAVALPPLMKWAGGKRRLIRLIVPHMLPMNGRYFEPFVGGGAVLFAIRPGQATIGDKNPELTNCYRQVKCAVDGLVERLRSFRNTEREYYRIRNWAPSSNLDRAARVLYLMRLSFNGIYRQNCAGFFNVPYGYKTHLSVVDEAHLRKLHSYLERVAIRTGDFAITCSDAEPGDTVYFDPPYTVAHDNNGFVKYNSHIFSWEDQRRLAEVAQSLLDKGCRVVVSNADHHSIHRLYPNFKRLRIARPSIIAADSRFRRPVTEALFVGTP